MQFTPTQKSVAAWGAIAVLTVFCLWLLGPVLTPFVVAAVFAYALTPLVTRLDGRRCARSPDGIAWEPVRLGEYGTGSVLDGQLLRDHTADWTIDQPLLIFDNGVVELINRCPQDLTGDGTVDSLDVLLFLGAWAQGNDLADWDDNGTVNTLDFLAFLNDWVTGC